MRITHELLLNVSQDEAQQQISFKRTTTLSKITIDTFQKHAGGDFAVDALGSKLLDLGDVTSPARGMYLEAASDCDVYLNGSADALQLRKAAAVSGGSVPAFVKLFLEANITSIRVTASQGAVTGTYVVWGDPLPTA